jgi:hypothetical protein
VTGLFRAQVLVHEHHGSGAFSNGGRYTLHRTVPNVARNKYAGYAGLQQIWRSF